MKRLKKWLLPILALLIVAPFCIVFCQVASMLAQLPKAGPDDEYAEVYLYEELGIDSRDYTILHKEDSHGGPFGEGLYFIVLDCAGRVDEVTALTGQWKAFPMPQSLHKIFASGFIQDFNPVGDKLFELNDSCLYYFRNRQYRAKDAGDTNIFDQASFNFILGIFNPENDTLCLMVFDT